MTTRQISLSIESHLANVELLTAAIARLCAFTPLSPVDVLRVELGVTEAINNAIYHAYSNEPGHEIRVMVCLADTEMTIDILEHGEPMGSLPSGKLPDPYAENGRGWPIIMACFEQVSYCSNAGANTVHLVKQFAAPTGN